MKTYGQVVGVAWGRVPPGTAYRVEKAGVRWAVRNVRTRVTVARFTTADAAFRHADALAVEVNNALQRGVVL